MGETGGDGKRKEEREWDENVDIQRSHWKRGWRRGDKSLYTLVNYDGRGNEGLCRREGHGKRREQAG
jgi:hypothetical protein